MAAQKKLHVGCGGRLLPGGWTHVDITQHPHVEVVCDIRKLADCFGAGSVDEIYACHVLEHVSRHDVAATLAGMFAVLAPGGRLRLAVPDIGKAVELYGRGVPLWPTLYGQFWGGQRDETDYHRVGFDFATLDAFLCAAGFRGTRRYDWRDFLPDGFDDFSRSYVPHLDFEHGENLSLNVLADKPAA